DIIGSPEALWQIAGGRRKTPAELQAQNLGEDGQPLAPEEERAAPSKQEQRREKLRRWVEFNRNYENYEERELPPIAEKLAERALRENLSLAQQRKKRAEAKAKALKSLRKANQKARDLATATAAKYSEELAALEGAANKETNMEAKNEQ
ncbi:MAG: hypothetical protein AAF975_08710, partial [Spirochaetota bacterium]